MADGSTGLTVGQAAERLGVSPHTLRYYERQGLLGDAVDRNGAGHRRFTEQALVWVQLLICLRETGMPLSQIKQFAELARQGTSTTAERLQLLKRHEAALDQHIERLQSARRSLQAKAAHYEAMLGDDDLAADLSRRLSQRLGS